MTKALNRLRVEDQIKQDVILDLIRKTYNLDNVFVLGEIVTEKSRTEEHVACMVMGDLEIERAFRDTVRLVSDQGTSKKQAVQIVLECYEQAEEEKGEIKVEVVGCTSSKEE